MTVTFRSWKAIVCAMLLTLGVVSPASAQKVLLVAAEDPASTEDVRAKLAATGLLSQVDVVDARTGPTPSLATLLTYDAILTWSDFPYGESDALGTALAGYVDAGHGVVQAVFSVTADPSLALGGRWSAWGFNAFASGDINFMDSLTLVPTQPAHPILDGVIGVNGGSTTFFHQNAVPGACASIVARWSNGEPLVTVRRGPAGGRVIGLNMYPVSGDALFGSWLATTDGARLMANALRFAASPQTPDGSGPKVALLAADDAVMAEDVSCKLQQTGLFGRVDRIDARDVTAPTLATLLQYDAVLAWNDGPYGAPGTLGDALADYIDQAHGVVQGLFTFDPAPGPRLQGRWKSAGYQAFSDGNQAPPATLSFAVNVPGHSILKGVSTFNGGTSSFHSAPILAVPGTTVVANWADGQPLVGVRVSPAGGRIVGLNMFPPSSDARPDLWDATTDGARLLANTLLFAATPPGAANRAPIASAGADQTIEASSPAGASFTVHASAADEDNDPLTYAWSGAASGSGTALTVTLPPPAAPSKSKTYTLTLTVSDGNGGQASDDVLLTVTDTTGPVLSNLPASTVTATATSDSGTSVSFGPVKANDAVDGPRPVACSPSGVFPVGDTVVTCSSSDTRGNTTKASFTVHVIGASTPGHMFGDGFVRCNDLTYDFTFDVRERGSYERGWLDLRVKGFGRNRRDDRFRAWSVDSVAFSDDPTIRPGYSYRPQVDTVLFSGTGEWNGRSGYHYSVLATDQGEPGRHRESIRIDITAPNGTVVAHVDGVLSGGNVQSVRIPHGR